MKRHVALESFSRDHNVALITARALTESRPGAEADFEKLWADELQDHFEQEESLLGPLLDSEHWRQLCLEHAQIRDLRCTLPGSVSRLGSNLEAHVRWEERTLFPWIESHASEEQMEALRLAADIMEERRWKGSPRRKELVEMRRRAKG